MLFFKKIKIRGKKLFKVFGPGFITGASDNDPSGIGTYSIGGAKYGLLLLWLIPFQLPFMFVIQEMSARIGIVTGCGLAANMKKILNKLILYPAIFILIIANTFNIGADIAVMASSIKLICGLNPVWGIILFGLLIVLTEVFVPYYIYSKILKTLSFTLLAYVLSAFIIPLDWAKILKNTFIPKFKFTKDFVLLATGFIGTTISPYLFFWQSSQEIEEKNLEQSKKIKFKKYESLKKSWSDTFIGTFFSQIVAFFIVVICYSVLHKNGITKIDSAYQAAKALKPLAGEYTFLLFSLGIISSGLLGISILAGSIAYSLSEIFSQKNSLSYSYKKAPFFYGTIVASTLIGILINLVGIDPIKTLLYAAVVNCIAAGPLIIFVLLVANNHQIMGKYKNGFWTNLGGITTFLIMFTSAILTFYFLLR